MLTNIDHHAFMVCGYHTSTSRLPEGTKNISIIQSTELCHSYIITYEYIYTQLNSYPQIGNINLPVIQLINQARQGYKTSYGWLFVHQVRMPPHYPARCSDKTVTEKVPDFQTPSHPFPACQSWTASPGLPDCQ